MQNMGLLMEYEDILLKKRKDFSATYIGQNASQKDIKELFQYVFENLLEWTPEMARDYLTMDIIQKLHLMRPLRKLEYPPEINIDQDLFSVAWMVYPEQIHISRHELVLNVYQKVLSDKLIKYPKKFFLEADGEVNACICLLYAINQEIPPIINPNCTPRLSDTVSFAFCAALSCPPGDSSIMPSSVDAT